MSANRAKDTTPEITLRKALWHAGLRGYRLHYKIKLRKSSPPYKEGVAALRRRDGSQSSPPYEGGVAALRGRGGSLFVRPDISFVSKKIAIFICSSEKIVQFGLSNFLHYSFTDV